MDVVDRCLGRVSMREDAVKAWAFLDPEHARRTAEELDHGPIKGPLHGVPIGIKDIIDVAGWPTTCGSKIYEGRRAAADAICVARLREAGAIILGKTVTTEFGYFRPGKTANPHNIAHTPGGSSSGSAAAVGDFMVPAALGAQTAGSVIRPAAFCGVVGFKSSWSSIPLDHIQPLSPSLDSLGWFVRAVEDAEILRSLLSATNYLPLGELPVAPRLAICETNEWPYADAEARATLQEAAKRLADAGATISTLTLPAEFSGLAECQGVVMAYEAARVLGTIADVHRGDISEKLTTLIETGHNTTESAYQAARRRADIAKKVLDGLFDTFVAIVTPSAPGPAPAGLSATGDPIFSRAWTLLEAPAAALPVRRDGANLPLGVQLIGRRGADRRLLQAAKWVTAAVSFNIE